MGLRKYRADEAALAKKRSIEAKIVVAPVVTAAAALQHPGLLRQFTSHIEGKNAQVMIYADRIEWERPRRALSNRGMGTEMIPVKSMSSVTTKRDGFINTKVSVITVGNTIDFRVSHDDANIVKDVLTQLILGNHPAHVQAAPTPVASTTPSFTDRLSLIESLHQQGVLTDEEYSAKRSAILIEM